MDGLTEEYHLEPSWVFWRGRSVGMDIMGW